MTEPKRLYKNGPALIIPPDGGEPVPYERCTTFIDVLGDRKFLEKWIVRKTAVGLSQRPDLLLNVATAKSDSSLDRICWEAKEASGASAGANIGTAIHALTERIDRGETPVIPEAWDKDIQAYRHAIKGVKIEAIEVFVVNDELKVAGTFDRVVRPLLNDHGKPMIADIKTGSIYDGGKIAMQLAVYANSQVYNVETGERTALDVSDTKGLVIHLPRGEGRCKVYEADLVEGWKGAQLAADVWAWRAKKGFLK